MVNFGSFQIILGSGGSKKCQHYIYAYLTCTLPNICTCQTRGYSQTLNLAFCILAASKWDGGIMGESKPESSCVGRSYVHKFKPTSNPPMILSTGAKSIVLVIT